jgi:hypothetical protein
MLRTLVAGTAALAVMSGVAFAQDYRDRDRDPDVTVYGRAEPAPVHVFRGGVIGVGVGALVGCLVTLPVCGPGAAVGAAIGGGTGAVTGAAVSAEHPYDYHDHYYRSRREGYRDDTPPPAPGS